MEVSGTFLEPVLCHLPIMRCYIILLEKHHHQENMASIKGRILFVTRFLYVTSLTIGLGFTHDT